MTSKLTWLTDDELTETLRQATSGYPLPASVEGNLRHAFAELQERRKAEKDSEPVAWTDEEELRDVNVAGIGYLFGIDREANKFADPRRQIMLYRHGQPAPVAPEEKPIPNTLSMYAVDAVAAIAEVKGWNACRAAMLQEIQKSAGAEEICRSNEKVQYLQTGNSPLWVGVDWAKGCEPGNSPVIPDGWIPVSERMPPSRYEVLVGRWWGEKPRWCCKWATYIPGHPDSQSSGWLIPGASWTPTHWMPLPAAPQEVKS